MADDSVDKIAAKHKEDCSGTVVVFKRDLQKVRTGKASAGLLENIVVDYYGSKMALNHLGQVSTPEARLIVVQVYDAGAVPAIEKAIQTAGLGLNPSREGNTLRVFVPSLTEETRRDIVRHLNKLAEEMRVSIRNHRRDANEGIKKLEKDGKATKDEAKRALDKIQAQTDGQIAEIDKLLKAKEAECMEV